MKYNEMIAKLPKFSKVIVTGPQRSGTTIAGRIIAKDLGYDYVDEGDHAAGTDVNNLRSFLKNKKKVVIQCPIMASRAHQISEWDTDSTAIVYMRRSVDDIHKSQKRINWKWDDAEKKFLKEIIHQERIRIKMDFSRRISALKYQLWDEHQKSKVKHSFNLDYESMKGHPMWLSKDKRKGFHAKQTS